MAVRTITTKLALDETEFKRELQQVNSGLRNLKSEMALVSEEFKGQSNTVEALTEKDRILRQQHEQQVEKVLALKRAVEEATEAYGDADRRTDDYRRQLNYAETELIKLNRELKNNERYLDEAKESADGTAHSIDEFGKEVKDSAGEVEDFGGLTGSLSDKLQAFSDKLDGGAAGGLLGKIGKFKTILAGGAVIGAVKGVADAVVDLVDSAEEYRKIMGTLETSSAQAGYSVEQTEAAYKRLYEVLGDSQSAATTVANLQAIGLEQDDLIELIDQCTGAWATYGDSIPIDSLAESVNETIQAGKVTGVFADALNWAGTSEDEFNEKLAATEDKSERARIVLDELKRQGLDQTAQAWRDNNEAIVNMHQAQDEWEQATAKLAEALAPTVAYIRGTFASALNWAADKIVSVREEAKKPIEVNYTEPTHHEAVVSKSSQRSHASELKNGSHANGLAYVPFDGYVAELHRGEAVLTASEASALRVLSADLFARAGASQNAAQGTTSPFAAGGQKIQIVTQVQLDKRTIGEAVTEYQTQEARRKG